MLDVCEVPGGEPKALLLSIELGTGKGSVTVFPIPLDGAVGLGSIVLFVKGKGGADVIVDNVVPATKLPVVVGKTLPGLSVLEIDSVLVVTIELEFRPTEPPG